MGDLRLVRPEKKHERQEMEHLKEFYASGSEINGMGGMERYQDDYDGWLEKLEADRRQMPNDERVPAETFFLVDEVVTRMGDGNLERDGHREGGLVRHYRFDRIIGIINIRTTLNDKLWQYGGHIGYSIRPSERRKGYAKVQLYLALKVCQQYGLEAVLLDCDKTNLGSAKTIRALGGRLIRENPYTNDHGEEVILQHYVIDVDAAIEKYTPIYEPLTAE